MPKPASQDELTARRKEWVSCDYFNYWYDYCANVTIICIHVENVITSLICERCCNDMLSSSIPSSAIYSRGGNVGLSHFIKLSQSVEFSWQQEHQYLVARRALQFHFNDYPSESSSCYMHSGTYLNSEVLSSSSDWMQQWTRADSVLRS